MSMENAMSKKLNGRGGRFVLLAAALLFAWGLRADTATVDGYTYTYSVTDGKVEIGTGEKVKAAVSPNPTGRLTVPSELGGYPVTGLGESAFSGTGVTDVTIPDGVTHIGPRAFASCASLENVTIGSGVTQIDFEVFPSCRHLRNIAVDPANTAYMSQNGMLLTKDGKTLVYGTCGNSVIPSGVTTIGRSAFFGRKLESVQFPSSVTNIGGWAFAWCRDLKLTIPDTVTQIDGDAFQSCFNLNVWLPRRFEGNLTSSLFRECSNLTVNYYDQVPVVAFRTEEGVVEQRECLPGTKVGSLPPASTCEGYAFEGWWTAADGEQATAETVVTNDVTYYAKWRGTATVDSYTYTYSVLNGQAEIGASNAWTRAISPSPTGHVTVPSSLGGFPVVGIGAYAFESSNLESVTIPEGVTGIGKNSFRFCANLESVTIPSGVARIDEYSFYYCTNLESVTIPSGVAKIGDFAFYGCSKLKGVHISDLVNWCRIAFGVLASPLRQAHELYLNGERVTELVIPEGVTAIGADAFAGCSGLTDVTIPASVTNVGVDAFAACSNLTNIVVDPGNANYTSKSGLLLTKDGRTLVQGVNGVVTIPAGVDVIAPDAFYGCGGLVDVVIPASVTNIGELAFTACGRLMSISVETGNEVYSSRDGMLLNKDGTTLILGVNGDVEIPSGVVTIGEWAFCGYPGLTRVVIPASVRDIGVAAFYECGNLTNTMMQGGVTNIGSAAFWGCSGLTRLVIPDGVTHIGQNAFSSCDGLTEVFIPDSVQSIGYGAFTSCGRLKNLTLPACMVEGDDGWTMWNVFQGTSVENVTMAEGITTIGSYAFAQGFEDETCPTHVTIPNSVTGICAYAFYNCPGLKSVTIPEGVVRIGAEAFLYCRNLAELAIPNSVKQIDARAFSDCRGLTEITIPGSVTNVGSSAFFRCQGLARVTVPACVLEAGLGTVFPASSSITNVVLSEGCREIARNALGSRRDFPNLAHVFIPGSVATIDAEAFRAFRGKIAVTVDPANAVYSSWNGMLLTKDGTTLIQGVNGDVTIPPGVTSIDARAFYNCNGLTRVVIPNSVTNIGNYAFNACSNLGDVWMPKHLEGKLSANVFANCGNATLNYYDKAYTVTFRTEEGVVEQRQCPDGVEIGSLPSTPTHTGYAFEGWWTAADGEQASEETVVTNDVTYYAKWRGTAAVDDYTYTYSVLNGQAEIGSSNAWTTAVSPKPTGHVTVPSSLGGFPVVGIGTYAFRDCDGLENVTIPNGVTTIGVGVFAECPKLTKIVVDPENVNYTSQNNLLLTKDGRTLVQGVNGEIEFPSCVRIIGARAFEGFSGLTRLVIPNSVTDIGESAFRNCRNLRNVWLPKHLRGKLSTSVFANCGNVTLNYYDAMCCVTFRTEEGIVEQRQCPAGMKVGTLPSTPTHEGYAFEGWWTAADGEQATGETAVTNDVTYYAKWRGTATVGDFTYMYSVLNGQAEIGSSNTWTTAVSPKPTGAVVIPSYLGGYPVTGIGQWAFAYCYDVTSFEIPKSVVGIGQRAFACCYDVTSFEIPKSVVDIHKLAFEVCYNLVNFTVDPANAVYSSRNGLLLSKDGRTLLRGVIGEVVIPSCVTEIGDSAFDWCYDLKDVTIPNGVLSIGTCAFRYCRRLTGMTIPQSVTNIGTRAFTGCDELWTFSVDPANRFYSSRGGLLLNKDGTVLVRGINDCGVVIPDGVTTIGEAAFECCDWLESVEIPESVTVIGDSAFFRCTSLESVEIPESVTTIGDSAFSGCMSLMSVEIPNSVVTIGDSAFYRCESLTSIEIPRGVTKIKYETFYGCTGLVSRVVIPDSVTNIEWSSFAWCKGLKEVWLPRGLEGRFYPYDVFWGCDEALTLNYYDTPLQTVVFQSDEGTKKRRLCPAGMTLGELPPSPTRAGAVFSGWWTADGERVSAETVVTGDMTLEPRWRAVAAPVITPDDGTTFRESESCTVTITCVDADAVIYYSTDGRTPRLTAACRYTGPFTIDRTTTIRAVAVLDGVRSAYVAATFTQEIFMPQYHDGRPDTDAVWLTFTTGGDAGWNYDWDWENMNGAYDIRMQSGQIGNEEGSWLQTSVVGRGTFSFRWKVDCEYDDFGEAAWDHLAVFTNGVEAVRMDGTRGWERMSFTFDDDGRHTIRWVFVKDGYDEEDAAYEDCAWLGRFSWNPADVAVDTGKGRTVTVPGTWLGKRTMRAATDMAANGRKVWECYLLGCDPEKAADDFRIASFEVVDGVPAFTFSHTRDGSGVSFEPRIRILGKARLDDAAWTEMPEGGDPALRFFKAEVALP